MTSLAAIQVFALDEPDLKRVLDAYAECTRPPGWDLVYKACVTPAPAAGAHHHRVDVADAHPVFDLEVTPPGKLASRNHAHDGAVDAGVDAIVAGDGDGPPLEADYLVELLAPFANTDVVATNATPVAPSTPIGVATNLVGWTHDAIVPHMNGQGHAISADGWLAAGPFDEAAEADRRAHEVRLEEEFEFRRRLEAVGDVVDTRARVHNDTRRTRCHLERLLLGEAHDPYCQRIGAASFAPRRR